MNTATGSFLVIQLMDQDKSKRCLPKFTFPSDFYVTCTANHWLNLEKSKDLFNVIIFTYLLAKKNELGCLEEQRSLITMGTFIGDNGEIKRLSTKNKCELVIVPHNPQKSSSFVPRSKKKSNVWYADRVSKQLSNGIAHGDVKASLKMRDLKPLHTK